jgi:hypothetical protein
VWWQQIDRKMSQIVQVPAEFPPIACVACGHPEMSYVRTIRSRRRPIFLPLFFCPSCNSFAMPSDYDQQIADPERAIAFHKKILERNLAWGGALIEFLLASKFPLSGFHEIGCGNGAVLKCAADKGISNAIGYEMNPHMSYFAQTLGVDIRNEMWTEDNTLPPASILACLSVLEHINDPRGLVRGFGDYAQRHDAFCIVNVPIIRESKWSFVFQPYEQGSPFDAADSHVLYFSPNGLEALLTKSGATNIQQKRVGGWNLHIASFTAAGADFLNDPDIDWSPIKM